MYEFKGKTLTPYQATDKVIEYLRKGIKDPDVLRLARELSNEREGYVFGIPDYVFAQSYAMACDEFQQIPDDGFNDTAETYTWLWGED